MRALLFEAALADIVVEIAEAYAFPKLNVRRSVHAISSVDYRP